jgi:hypothetical protein
LTGLAGAAREVPGRADAPAAKESLRNDSRRPGVAGFDPAQLGSAACDQVLSASCAVPAFVGWKWGLLIPGRDARRRNAARKHWTANRIELRLIKSAKPTIVAISEDKGSMVSGEK